ncbi:MAG: glycosyltransferase [Lachnospiraceae bacterium]|nr:glycosyltransferase [Lachnospiraceae bacterium]
MSEDRVKISIVTVSFDSAATIADTIRSVLGQTYPPFEYIIMDGGSKDSTLDVIEGFRDEFEQKGIALIVTSEKDEGMYDAMNKGIAASSGDIVGIINSDDWYEKDALETVADTYLKTGFDLFYADLRMVFPDGRSFVKHSRNRSYATSRDWNHPTTFITRSIYENNRYRNDTLHDDYDLILRLKKQNVKTVVVNKVLADFRMNGVSHNRSLSKALSRIKIKYKIYRQNGYGRYYIFECMIVELGKLVIG